jgi:arylsulfatase
MVERMDYQVGRIVEQLDRMGAAENTLLIFISDNGATPGAGEESGPDTDGPREPHRLACRSDHQRRCG